MNAAHQPNPATRFALRRALAALAMLAATVSLAGCIRTRSVTRVVVVPHVLDATLDQLVDQLAARYQQVQSMSASVEIIATTGGEHRGEVKESPSFSGYIILRKPQDLHILMLVPVIRSRALEMVSDGKTFRLFIPSKNKAVEGQDTPALSAKPAPASGGAQPSNSGLYELRPNIIRDALLIPPLGNDEFVTLTESSRTLPGTRTSKDATEEPDYDLTILRLLAGHSLQRERVVHIGRVDLHPYRQDIYDAAGRIVTVVEYSKYEKAGDIEYPANILITRPIDEYTLRLIFSKATFNQKIDDEQFMLKIPEGVPVQKM